ncbi:MAG: phage GP46 family protein [Pseudomonadota bacterium]
MTDLALALDPVSLSADLCLANGDLVLDDGLASLALMSLLTDARAQPRDVEAGETDLRGWWGDALSTSPLGGRLWTLARAKATEENRRRAADFAAEALAWMTRDGIATAIDVTATRSDGDGSGATLHLEIVIHRPGGTVEHLAYDLLWQAMGSAAGGTA